MVITVSFISILFVMFTNDSIDNAPIWAKEYAYAIKVEMGLIMMILITITAFCLYTN